MYFQINLGSLGFWGLGLHQTSCLELFYILKHVSIDFCYLGECCFDVKLTFCGLRN